MLLLISTWPEYSHLKLLHEFIILTLRGKGKQPRDTTEIQQYLYNYNNVSQSMQNGKERKVLLR